MLLHRKFGLLALIYVVSLSANLLVSAWCILVYFRSAFVQFESAFAREQQIERVRGLLRRQVAQLEAMESGGEVPQDYRENETQFAAAMRDLERSVYTGSLSRVWSDCRASEARRQEAAARRLAQVAAATASGRTAGPMAEADRRAFLELDRLLGLLAGGAGRQRQDSVQQAAQVQQRVVMILVANAACGGVLCAVGLLCFRRWVVRPIAALREATRQIAAGNFGHRIRPQSRDEIGRLSHEVNHMASTIVEMQEKMIEQQRLAAAGEMVERVAHNIRNPLAGIRGLAEATAQRHADDPETIECQKRIIGTVDRFEKWLRDLQQSVAPMRLSPQLVPIAGLIENVVTVLRPMCDRRRVQVDVDVDSAIGDVRIDPTHMEQALVALLTNAVQASEPGQAVRVAVRPAPEAHGYWRISVEDDGPGVPPEIRDKIFLPYFTTKPEGNGIGLAIANKVVRVHGGHLTLEPKSGRGSRFVAVLPGHAAGGCNGGSADC